ncbi:hypothetical protein [Streptomyces sp. N35]|uniref:SCO2400 family protein n=1 Tax=Streptomyces sp. N35 TaxID=2795730 RepID=UPI0018F4ACBC|nr:hypothetical protein [Streptomyces sp. N35]
MDYCHPCRRHLNGALACPGCGTPVDAVRRYAEEVAAVEAAPESDQPDEQPSGTRSHRGRRAPRSRASQRAHRRKRHKVLLITAGLALAAGGLSLAELGTEHPTENVAAPSASPDRSVPDPSMSSSFAETGTASDGPTSAAQPTRQQAEPSASESSSAPVQSPDGSASALDPAPSDDDPPATSAPRPTRTSKPKPKPEPTPSKDCERFLFWCT